ncbi:energy-coupling factor transporter transmembrane component T family protein [Oenococcus kitaharae]|uniref:ABC-type cobalt transport systempermease component n=1 Tax=Oenococcus kitaharae DSM 17330 TaxID=1045004 RepID=G9WG68_9LACO|nr:energy-coupling factor transporter transmembrane component T [Oenococcus kitaharae]EHN59676.1 ABC-type cobalt transport systempermease component [Oenococcus kitaharae DSM 17330]
MPDFIFGQFMPGKSFIHDLDARNKLISVLLIIASSLLTKSCFWLLLFLFISLLSVRLAKLNLGFFLRGIRFFVFMIFLTAVLQLFFSPGGQVIFSWGFLYLTQMGLQTGVIFFLRFLTALVAMTVFLLTTSPIAISDTLAFFLSPLKVFKLPIDDITLTLSIALRFVPTMIATFSSILDAQKSRGAVFNRGSLLHRMKMYVPVMAPLFLNSVKRAEDLAAAMIMRGYTDGRHRTRFRVMHWRQVDTVVMAAWLLIILLLFITR